MQLYYLFSRNQKVGSRVISWASGLLVKDLEKVPSHMAVLIEQDGYESLVFESTLDANVRILPYKNWLQINEECYKIECIKKRTNSEVFTHVHNLWGKKYDWGGIAFFAICFIKHILFKIPFPKENAWQTDDKYFCNELGGVIVGYGKYSMVTPAKMCSDFLKMVGKNG
jgi:hypothetical protein